MIAMAMSNGTHYTNKLTIVKTLSDHWQIIVAIVIAESGPWLVDVVIANVTAEHETLMLTAKSECEW